MRLPGGLQCSGAPTGSTPESQGISSFGYPFVVEAADKNIDSLHSIVIVRHGQVIAEGCGRHTGRDAAIHYFHLSKSFTFHCQSGPGDFGEQIFAGHEVLKILSRRRPQSPATT